MLCNKRHRSSLPPAREGRGADGAREVIAALDEIAPMSSKVDWAGVALYLASHVESALVVIDSDGCVRAMTVGAETKLGWAKEDLEGRPWLGSVCLPKDGKGQTERLAAVLSGQRQKVAFTIRTQAGARRAADMEVKRIGQGRGVAVVGAIGEVRDLDLASFRWSEGDFEYQISAAPFGEVLGVLHVRSGTRPFVAPGSRCFEVFLGRSTPCDHCPVAAGQGDWPRVVTRVVPTPHRIIEIFSARPSATRKGVIDVSVRRLPFDFIGRFVEARTADLAVEANLSDRERSVLRYLVMGRSLEDIGKILGISSRTVKFHQANIVEKVGADSRADLLRLIF
jgi:PAS domain S-box-containing protein